MLAAAHSSGHHEQPPPKISRRPLQPTNHQSPSFTFTTPNRKPSINPLADNQSNNKENQRYLYCHVTPNQTTVKKRIADDEMEASLSLADELSAVREKLERQRIDREKNEGVLREKSLAMDRQLKEILDRGEIQKQLEIELDRLYRLKEIRLACTRISQIRSLRDKEEEKKMMKKQDLENKASACEAREEEDRDDEGEGKGEMSSSSSKSQISVSEL